ncbi:MAG: hypothetical protein KAR40_09680 [Candidatus Sabulitectum sp.]|nr:hypothetical protein [Candidatus Sabulitectum sp.]
MAKDMSNMTWVYHKDYEAMVVTTEKAKELYKEGWADTPAAFKDDVPEEDDPTEEVEAPVESEEVDKVDVGYDEDASDSGPDSPSEDDDEDSDTDTGEDIEEAPTDDPEASNGESEKPVKKEKHLSMMNVVELTAVALKEGIVLEPGATKAEMKNTIVNHRNTR